MKAEKLRLIIGLGGLIASAVLCISSYNEYTKSSNSIGQKFDELESQKELLLTSTAALKDAQLADTNSQHANSNNKAETINNLLECRSMSKRVELFSKELSEEGLNKGKEFNAQANSNLLEADKQLFQRTGLTVAELIATGATNGITIAELSSSSQGQWQTSTEQICKKSAELYKNIATYSNAQALAHHQANEDSTARNNPIKQLEVAWIVQITAFTIANLIDIDINLPL